MKDFLSNTSYLYHSLLKAQFGGNQIPDEEANVEGLGFGQRANDGNLPLFDFFCN